MPFLSPNQQSKSTEGTGWIPISALKRPAPKKSSWIHILDFLPKQTAVNRILTPVVKVVCEAGGLT